MHIKLSDLALISFSQIKAPKILRWPPKKQTNKPSSVSPPAVLACDSCCNVFARSCFQEDSELNSTQIFRCVSVSFPPAFTFLPFGFWCRLHPTSADQQRWFFITSSCPPDSRLRSESQEVRSHVASIPLLVRKSGSVNSS